MNQLHILVVVIAAVVAVPTKDNFEDHEVGSDVSILGDRTGKHPSFSDDHFWFSVALEDVNWEKIFSSIAPFLKEVQKKQIINTAGKDGVNPIIVIAILMLEDKTTISNLQGEELLDRVSKLADSLADEFEAYDKSGDNHMINAAAFAVWKTLQSDNEKFSKFLDMYQKILEDNADALKTVFEKTAPTSRELFKMQFPWPLGDTWGSGGTHSTSGSGKVWSALDFWWWQKPWGWGCLTPNVTAAHSGTVARSPYSECNVRIVDESGEFQTGYYHMGGLFVQPGDKVKVGQILGPYAPDKKTALCNGGSSTGPHLHFTLFDKSGRPITLHNQHLSGYRVDAGDKNYDGNCERCYYEKNGKKFCPNKGKLLNDDWDTPPSTTPGPGEECKNSGSKKKCQRAKRTGCKSEKARKSCQKACGICE